MSTKTPVAEDAIVPAQVVRGGVVIACMFLFGTLVVSGFWTYWYFANRPFRELQQAILAKHPNTFPQVAGGRVESRRTNGPETLRVVVRTLDFDPKQDDACAEELAESVITEASDHVALDDYERLELVFFRKYKEQRSSYWQRAFSIDGGRLTQERVD